MPSDHSPRQTENVALLRAIVGGFVARPTHPVADARQFEQLALGLIDLLDAEAAAAVLRPLLIHPEAPEAVFERLRDKGGACAALAVELAPRVTSADLIAALGQPELSRAAARRGDLNPASMSALALRGDMETLRALAANLALRFDPPARRALLRAARDDRGLARLLLDRGDFDAERATLFLAATRAERRAIVIDARRSARARGLHEEPAVHPAMVDRFETAALRGDRAEMGMILVEVFNCEKERARALLLDRQGEPLALALAALGVSPAKATRIFRSAGALISHDAIRVRGLVAMARAIPRAVAAELIAAMTGADKDEREAAGRQPEIARSA
jgi:hypothetical protein